MKTQKFYTQHSENKTWMDNVAFYRHELGVMESRLMEIASKYTSEDVLRKVEQFQNRFVIQKEHLDELSHEINISNDTLKAEVERNPVALEHRKVSDHADARGNMQAFERSYAPLRNEFNAFLARWM